PSAVVTRRLWPRSRPPIPAHRRARRLAIESSGTTVTPGPGVAAFLAAWLLAIAAPIREPPPAPIRAPNAPGPACGDTAKPGTARGAGRTGEPQPIAWEWTWASLSGYRSSVPWPRLAFTPTRCAVCLRIGLARSVIVLSLPRPIHAGDTLGS